MSDDRKDSRKERDEAAEKAKKPDQKTHEEKSDALDEGLEDTFPASDPVAATGITRTGGPREGYDPKKDKQKSNKADD